MVAAVDPLIGPRRSMPMTDMPAAVSASHIIAPLMPMPTTEHIGRDVPPELLGRNTWRAIGAPDRRACPEVQPALHWRRRASRSSKIKRRSSALARQPFPAER